MSQNRYYVWLAVALVLGAFGLRVIALPTTPPGFWFDEAYNAMDAVWMPTHEWPVFLPGNNGREALYHYLLWLAIEGWGGGIVSARLVSAMLGTLSVALIYRLGRDLFHSEAMGGWIAVLMAAGLAVSFWHVSMSRTAYRANLLPVLVLITTILFWRGWRSGHWGWYAAAGASLGLSQYTYFSARLLPLVFGLFALIVTLQNRQHWMVWRGLLVMAGSSFVVALPLLWLLVENPALFWGRTLDVATPATGLVSQLGEAIQVFGTGRDPNWRHHLPTRPLFDVISLVGFWVGLLLACWRWRTPRYLLLVLLLGVMWLPAPLSQPAHHTLRLSGVLIPFYGLVAVGLLWLVSLGLGRWRPYAGSLTLVVLLGLSGSRTTVDYFYHWANHHTVYTEFDTPIVALAQHITASEQVSAVIPHHLYGHAAFRYWLHYQGFSEEILRPEDVTSPPDTLFTSAIRPADGTPPAYVWLWREAGQPGRAYVSAVRRSPPLKTQPRQPITNVWGEVIAYQIALDPDQALAWFPTRLPTRPITATWNETHTLSHYTFEPVRVPHGESNRLDLSWQILPEQPLDRHLFVQVVDRHGQPAGQHELDPFSKKLYRWRAGDRILEQIPLRLDSTLPPSLYFVRLGFFDLETGQRLPLSLDGQPHGDTLILGPFYITAPGLLQPQFPLEHKFGAFIKLLGFTLHDRGTHTDIDLFWQVEQSPPLDYTVFLQLLDPQQNILAQNDTPPLRGLYPTSRWQPGDILVDTFTLAVPIDQLGGDNRLVTGLYNPITGERLPAFAPDGTQLMGDSVMLRPGQ